MLGIHILAFQFMGIWELHRLEAVETGHHEFELYSGETGHHEFELCPLDSNLGIGRMVPLEGADNCINIILTSIYYLPNILLVPLHFHSVVHAMNPLLLQMTQGVGIPIHF